MKCSANVYLIVNNWFKLFSSNILCPNHDELFQKHSPDIYHWSQVYANCFETNKTFYIHSDLADLLPMSVIKNKKLIRDRHQLLQGTINVDNLSYPFKADIDIVPSTMFVKQGSLKWSSNNIYSLYMAFKAQPIMCRLSLNLREQVENQKCTGILGRRNILCYYEPLSKSKSKPPVTNVNWTQLDVFINDETYPPSNWKDKGGYILDVRLLNTGTKLTTTLTTTMSTSQSIYSTWMMTTFIKNDTRLLSITSSTSDLIASSDKDTLTSLATSITSIITTTIETSVTTSSTIASTNFDHTIATDMEITTAILPNTTTICDTVADTTATLQIIFNPSTNTSTVLKPPKNKSKVLGKPSNKSRLPTISLNKKPSPNKSSSFRSLLLTVLLISFILCLIGLVLFFLFHSQRNQQNDDESLLDRNTSDESEIDPSTEHEIPIYANLEPSEIIKSRKGGRMFSQLDPEAF